LLVLVPDDNHHLVAGPSHLTDRPPDERLTAEGQ
jgi:hypothetical protein